MADSVEEWPFYAYTIRNLGPICFQFLDFVNRVCPKALHKHALHVIEGLARAGKYSDDHNKVTVKIVCTSQAETLFKLDKLIRKRFATKTTSVSGELFAPILIIACPEEASNLFSLMQSVNMSQEALAFVFVAKENERVPMQDTGIFLSKTIWTSATKDVLFSKADEILLERVVLQFAPNMVDTLKSYLEQHNKSSLRKLKGKSLETVAVVFLFCILYLLAKALCT